MHLAALGLAAALAVSAPSSAAFPGANGKLAFQHYHTPGLEAYMTIGAMNPNGSGFTLLTDNPAEDYTPAWSADGTKLVFISTRGAYDIAVVDADGSNKRFVTDNAGAGVIPSDPAWSPDGTKIVFAELSSATLATHIKVIGENGSGKTDLTPDATNARCPDWSPDGSKIAYAGDAGIVVMGSDGSSPTTLPATGGCPSWAPDGATIAFGLGQDIIGVNPDGTGRRTIWHSGSGLNAFDVAWSPDCRKLVFAGLNAAAGGTFNLYIVGADGSALTNLTPAGARQESPTWQPLPSAPVTCGGPPAQPTLTAFPSGGLPTTGLVSVTASGAGFAPFALIELRQCATQAGSTTCVAVGTTTVGANGAFSTAVLVSYDLRGAAPPYCDTGPTSTCELRAIYVTGGTGVAASTPLSFAVLTNAPPVAASAAVTTVQGTPVDVTLTATDANGDALTFAVVSEPAHGSLSGTPPNLTYTPDSGFFGPDSFTFHASDGQALSDVATISITVTEANPRAACDDSLDNDGDGKTDLDDPGCTAPADDDETDTAPPVVQDVEIVTDEDVPVAIELAVSNPAGTPLTWFWSDAEHGLVTGPEATPYSGAPPTLIYRPNLNYHGPDSFTFWVCPRIWDYCGSATLSNVATVSITVRSVNDLPVAEDRPGSEGYIHTAMEDTPQLLELRASDADGDALTFDVLDQPAHGEVTELGESCGALGLGSYCRANVLYKADVDYDGVDSFTYLAHDGTGESNLATVSIRVFAYWQGTVTLKHTIVQTLQDGSVHLEEETTFFLDGNPIHGLVGPGSSTDTLREPAPVESWSQFFRWETQSTWTGVGDCGGGRQSRTVMSAPLKTGGPTGLPNESEDWGTIEVLLVSPDQFPAAESRLSGGGHLTPLAETTTSTDCYGRTETTSRTTSAGPGFNFAIPGRPQDLTLSGTSTQTDRSADGTLQETTVLSWSLKRLPGGCDGDDDLLGDALEAEIGTDRCANDTDGDGFWDGVEYLHGSGPRDPMSTPVAPPGFDPHVPPSGQEIVRLEDHVDCLDVAASGINSCALRPGDLILWRWTGELLGLLESFLGSTHFTHSLMVIGRFDLTPGDANDRLQVVLADITPGSLLGGGHADGRTDFALTEFNYRDAAGGEPDAVGFYRPVLSRASREGAARNVLAYALTSGAGLAANQDGLHWNAPAVSYSTLPTALAPDSFYCSSLLAWAYGDDFSPPLDFGPFGVDVDTLFITPDDLLVGFPGITKLGGYNTDAGVVAVFSPAHVLVTDPQGRRTGIGADGLFHDEIPGAQWRDNGHSEGVSVPGMGPDWTVTLAGHDTGTYALFVRTLVDGVVGSDGLIGGFTRPGKIETYRFGDLRALADRPVAVDDSATTGSGLPVDVDVLANDFDLNDDLAASTLQVTRAADHGVAKPAQGRIRYAPSVGFVGEDSFDYRICDGTGLCSEAVVTVTVEGTPGAVMLRKTTDGSVNPSRDISFVLTGPELPTAGVTHSTFGDQDGVLEWPDLTPGQYTVCEKPVPAGFTSFWRLDGAVVTPYNPDARQSPPTDLGTRCYDFSVASGQARAFDVDNSHPGGEPRAIGYWKAWNRCTGGNQAATAEKNGGAAAGFFLVDDLLPQLVGDFSFATCPQAVKLLSKQDRNGKSKSSDAAYELGAQLLAARFNVAAGAETCAAVQQTVLDAQALLDQIGFTGLGDYLGSKSKSQQRPQALSLAAGLDRYNRGDLC